MFDQLPIDAEDVEMLEEFITDAMLNGSSEYSASNAFKLYRKYFLYYDVLKHTYNPSKD